MESTTLGFALGLLFGATKVLAIGAVGFGIAWWRARSRVRALEAAEPKPASLEERLDRLEQSLDYQTAHLERLATGQEELRRLLLPRQT